MIHAEQIQYRGVKVVDRNRLLLRPLTKLVAGADHLAAFDLRARHPHSCCISASFVRAMVYRLRMIPGQLSQSRTGNAPPPWASL